MTSTDAVGPAVARSGPHPVLKPRGGRPRPGLWLTVGVGTALSRRLAGALDAATAFLAHSLSSARYVSGIDPASFYDDYFGWRRAYRLIAPGLTARIDDDRHETRVRLYSRPEQTCRFVDGLGTVPIRAGLTLPAPPGASVVERAPGALTLAGAGDGPVAPASQTLARAMSGGKTDGCAVFATRALVVVQHGQVIGEYYAEGYGPHTPVIGYSLTKSLANTIVGRMAALGLMSVDEADLFAEWRGANDPRRAITVDHLLGMTSGLRMRETHSGFDPVSRLLFLTGDMGAFAASAAPGTEPGSKFAYTSANTVLLARLIRERLGGSASDVRRFLDTELLAPLGIDTMLIESDAAGTPILSTFAYASARDWARLALLYLHDGCVGTRRLLAPGWVGYTTTSTAEPTYGAAFRLNRQGGRDREWHRPDLPADTFFGHGHLGQFVVVIPSRDMVVVRLGAGRADMRRPVAAMSRAILDATGP